MKKEKLLNITRASWKIFVAFFLLIGGVFSIFLNFFVSNEDNKDEEDDALMNGSNLIGEHNFRTRKNDSGTDPYGWYEEDL